MLGIEPGAAQPSGGKVFDGLQDSGGIILPDIVQHKQVPVKGSLLRFRQELGGQIIIQNVVKQPALQIGQYGAVQLDVVRFKGLELPVALHGVLHPDLVQKLINVEKGKGSRGLLHLTPAKLCSPGKIAPQLLVGEGLIGGVVAHYVAGIGIIVLVICQELRLLDKNDLPGL